MPLGHLRRRVLLQEHRSLNTLRTDPSVFPSVRPKPLSHSRPHQNWSSRGWLTQPDLGWSPASHSLFQEVAEAPSKHHSPGDTVLSIYHHDLRKACSHNSRLEPFYPS